MINLAVDFSLQIRHFFRPLIDQQENKNNVGIICANRLCNFLQQNGLAHARRRNDQAALPTTERRQQIDRARADGTGVWILEDNSALRKLRCELVKGSRLFPDLGLLLPEYDQFDYRTQLLA